MKWTSASEEVDLPQDLGAPSWSHTVDSITAIFAMPVGATHGAVQVRHIATDTIFKSAVNDSIVNGSMTCTVSGLADKGAYECFAIAADYDFTADADWLV